jgi:Na+/H+ antiporter NhaD/arsenite permease-like protein
MPSHLSPAEIFAGMGPGASLLAGCPLALLLSLIAVLPLIPAVSGWWAGSRNKLIVSLACALAGVLLYIIPTRDGAKLLQTGIEYLAFISLLGSLFVISGGIHISGAFAGFPWVNTLFLFLGALLANVLGTTGASMLLIRPLLRANQHRHHKTHIVIFFIFIVSNTAGLLTPLGDPPLYLGFLKGVPFGWTLRLLPQWALAQLLLLLVFHLLDGYWFGKEAAEAKQNMVAEVAKAARKLHVQGKWNLAYLAGVLVSIVLSGYVLRPALAGPLGEVGADLGANLFQILVMLGLALASWRTTAKSIHAENNFSFAPIQEVAILFLGIFGAMIPALALLAAKGAQSGLSHPWQYFWMSGALSSFLDNAPTYLTFASLAAGQSGVGGEHLGRLAQAAPQLLAAVACGSVFMGANSYIGNGPNFMVKAIADHHGVKMPSFGGYMLWSLAILIPLFILETFLFFL